MPEPAPKSDDVDELMKMLGVEPGKAGSAPTGPAPSPAAQEEVREMAKDLQAGKAVVPEAKRPELESFTPVSGKSEASIELLKDVDLHVRIELGRSRMLVQDILKLSSGSVVELDRPTGDPLDVYVNDRLVARGEVLVINDNFAIRITEVVQSAKEAGK